MSTRIAAVEIPDTKLVAEARARPRGGLAVGRPPLAADLPLRRAAGREQGLRYDPELLYVGAMFHDIGQTVKYQRTDQRFEIDGAEGAEVPARPRYLRGRRNAGTGIALHTTPEIPLHMAPEIALVTHGVEPDALAIGYHAITHEQRAAVTTTRPQPDFKRQILEACTDRIADRPDCPGAREGCPGALRARFPARRLRRGDSRFRPAGVKGSDLAAGNHRFSGVNATADSARRRIET